MNEQTSQAVRRFTAAVRDGSAKRESYYTTLMDVSADLERACRQEAYQLGFSLSKRSFPNDRLTPDAIAKAVERASQNGIDRETRLKHLTLIAELAMLARDISTNWLLDLGGE